MIDKFTDISPPVHGGRPVEEGVLDFSYSVNPFPLPDAVYSAYKSAFSELNHYPDTDAAQLKEALSSLYGYNPSSVLITNGSAEAFSLIASALLHDGGSSIVFKPGYSDYMHVSCLHGDEVSVDEVSVIKLDPAKGFAPDYEKIEIQTAMVKPRLIWFCSPHNPTGVVFRSEEIKKIAAAAEEYGGWVVVDEAYSSFLPEKEEGEYAELDNVIVVRSLTKDFSIAGLRLGFIHAPAEMIRILNLFRPCWSVNTPAQTVGVALLKEINHFKANWEKILELKRELTAELQKSGVDPLSASMNKCGIFIFFKAPSLAGNETFTNAMKSRGIIIRDCATMGAPGYCRVGVKLHADNMKLVEAVKDVLNG